MRRDKYLGQILPDIEVYLGIKQAIHVQRAGFALNFCSCQVKLYGCNRALRTIEASLFHTTMRRKDFLLICLSAKQKYFPISTLFWLTMARQMASLHSYVN